MCDRAVGLVGETPRSGCPLSERRPGYPIAWLSILRHRVPRRLAPIRWDCRADATLVRPLIHKEPMNIHPIHLNQFTDMYLARS